MSYNKDFITENGTLTASSVSAGDIYIPEGTIAIAPRVFQWKKISGVVIPEGVTEIGDFAFAWCRKLKSVTLPQSLSSIGEGAFQGCCGLSTLVLPDHLTAIGPQAFSDTMADSAQDYCNLTVVSIPEAAVSLLTPKTCPIGRFGLVIRQENGIRCGAFRIFTSKNPNQLDRELSASAEKDYEDDLYPRLFAMLGRLQNPTELSPEVQALFIAHLGKYAKKIIASAEAVHCPELVLLLAQVGVVTKKNKKALQKRLITSPVPEIAILADASYFV